MEAKQANLLTRKNKFLIWILRQIPTLSPPEILERMKCITDVLHFKYSHITHAFLEHTENTVPDKNASLLLWFTFSTPLWTQNHSWLLISKQPWSNWLYLWAGISSKAKGSSQCCSESSTFLSGSSAFTLKNGIFDVLNPPCTANRWVLRCSLLNKAKQNF